MKIAVIVAMPEEFHAVSRCLEPGAAMRVDGLTALYSRAAGHDVMLLESGMGFDNATSAVEMLIREFSPGLLVSTGFCGGLAPELQAGDVVVAKNIVILDDNGFDEVPMEFSDMGGAFVSHQATEGKRIVAGTFVSTRSITSKSCLAGMLPGHYANPVVEMESAAIAAVAVKYSIPLLALRAVSDCADEDLGFSLDEFCDPDMRRIRPYKVLLTILRKPYITAQLVRLSRSSRKAADSLTAALVCLFPAF